MKLAEALIVRADCQKRIEQLKQRLIRNAKVQEGDQPAESPEQLLQELEHAAEQLLGLIQRINRTNSVSNLENGQTITDAVARRDVLRIRANIYRELAQAATITMDRFSKSEVKFHSTIEVKAVQKQADALSQEIRLLDTQIQESNWKTLLLD